MSESDDGRYVDVPTDLQVALAEHASAMSAWRGMTPGERAAHVTGLGSASDPEARARCLSDLIQNLEIRVPGASTR